MTFRRNARLSKNCNPLGLIERDFILPPGRNSFVVRGEFMIGDMLRH
jgi:hypothetical protein